MILSVIVPVYNSENTLHRCLDSLLEQWNLDTKDYEIICVNDGSTDGSLGILQSYKADYPRVLQVIDKANGGVASARNEGLRIAKGELIAFCDADDYLKKGAYQYLYENYWTRDLDLLRFNSITLDRYVNPVTVNDDFLEGEIRFDGKGYDLFGNGNWLSFACSAIYKHSFLELHKVFYRDLKIGEDLLFNLDVYVQNPNVRFVTSKVYFYTTSDTQATKNREKQFIRESVSGYLQMFSIFERYAKEKPEIASIMDSYKMIELSPCASRALSSDFDQSSFSSFVQSMKSVGVFPLQAKNKKENFIKCVFSNYFCYKLCSVIYRRLFIPLILPYLSRN